MAVSGRTPFGIRFVSFRSINCRDGESRLTEQLIGQLGYFGIALILVLGGLGLPIPEEAPIVLAAVLSRNGQLKSGPLAFASCLVGVLLGDMVVYFLGFFHGEKVLSLPVTRRLLTRQRESQIKGYFHRHGFKILVSGRFVPGFRTAAYLTAGILKLPPLKLFLTDLLAATLSTSLLFGLGYAFADQIQSGIREVQQWVTLGVALGVAIWLLYRYYEARQRAGLPVGPPVLDSDDVPVPPAEPPAVAPSPSHGDEPVPPLMTAREQTDVEDIATTSPLERESGGLRRDVNAQPPPTDPLASPAVVVDVESASSGPPLESPSR
jgi:membrane protein DedA with SNARE-associated domain